MKKAEPGYVRLRDISKQERKKLDKIIRRQKKDAAIRKKS